MSETRAYWNGRRARSQDRPREIADDRSTPASRKQWYAGWDEEDGYKSPKPTPEQKQKFLAGLAVLKQSLES